MIWMGNRYSEHPTRSALLYRRIFSLFGIEYFPVLSFTAVILQLTTFHLSSSHNTVICLRAQGEMGSLRVPPITVNKSRKPDSSKSEGKTECYKWLSKLKSAGMQGRECKVSHRIHSPLTGIKLNSSDYTSCSSTWNDLWIYMYLN